MATVNGMTAEAMAAIRNGHVVTADFDSANHLILTRYDGTQIDSGVIGASSTTLQGVVELATSAETITGTDAVRAVTPAGLSAVRLVTGIAESAAPSSYPLGVSAMNLSTGSGWSINSGFGYLLTNRTDTARAFQTFSYNAGGTQYARVLTRSYHDTNGGGGWTAWRENMLMASLTAGSFTQATALSTYPNGMSRLYYTTANSTSWDFSGLAGEVVTYYDSTNNYGHQTFTQHVWGSGSKPVIWSRTSDNTTGWSAWSILSEAGAWSSWTPTWTTSSGLATPSYGNAVIACRYTKTGRKVEGWFDITFGSTTNFGSGAVGSDNWLFALPVTAARAGDHLGFVELRAASNSVLCMGRIRTNNTTTVLLDISGARADNGTIAGYGDVDSISPWTWAASHSIRGNFVYESAA